MINNPCVVAHNALNYIIQYTRNYISKRGGSWLWWGRSVQYIVVVPLHSTIIWPKQLAKWRLTSDNDVVNRRCVSTLILPALAFDFAFDVSRFHSMYSLLVLFRLSFLKLHVVQSSARRIHNMRVIYTTVHGVVSRSVGESESRGRVFTYLRFKFGSSRQGTGVVL